MRDQPDGAELLKTARTLLRDQLIPALPADQKYPALMIANAMAIAARQLDAGDEPLRQQWLTLRLLLDKPDRTVPVERETIEAELTAMNRTVAEQIRNGAADTDHDRRAAIYDYLRQMTRQRVTESNPGFFDR